MTHKNNTANDPIRCEECRRRLARCIQEAEGDRLKVDRLKAEGENLQSDLQSSAFSLQPDLQVEGLTEHLLACEACFSFYADLVFPEAEGEKGAPYIGRRPVWGPLVWGPEEEDRMIEEVVDRIDEMEEAGGLLVIKYDRSCRKSALLLLIRLRAELKEEGKVVRTFLPADRDLLPLPGWEEEDGYDCALIFEAPCFVDLLEYLEKAASIGRGEGRGARGEGRKSPIAIAGGAREQWADLEIPVNHLLLSWDPPSPKGEERFCKELEAEAAKDLERTSGDEEMRRAHLFVALLDSLGVPTPVALLGRLLGKGEGETFPLLERAKGLLFPVEAEGVSRVCTEGEAVAARVVEQLCAEGQEEGRRLKTEGGRKEKSLPSVSPSVFSLKTFSLSLACREIIRAALPSERLTVLRLLHGLLQRGQGRPASQLVQEEEGVLQKLFEEASPAELLAWGKTLQGMGTTQFDQAWAVFKKGLEAAPDNIYFFHAYADLLGRRRGCEQEAEGYFQRARKMDPENIYVLQAFGDLKRRRGPLREAEALFLQALRIDERSIFTLVSYANLLIKEERYEEAEERLRNALKIDSRNVQALHSWGQLEKERHNYAEARGCFKEVLRIDPHNVHAIHALGQMARERGHWREAQECFEEALRLKPDNCHVLHALGELWGEMNDSQAALGYFEEVLSLDCENLEAIVARAVLEGKRENFSEAQQGFEQARKLEEGNLHVAVAWGEMEIRRKDFQQARMLLEGARRQLRESRRREPSALLNVLARLEAAEHDYDSKKSRRWRRYFERSLEADPKNGITYNSWAQVEARAKDFDKAEECFLKALESDTDNAYTHQAYGEMLSGLPGRQEDGQVHRSRAQELGMEELSANISMR